jgi:Asp/Glu/hydantoin racemase
MRIMLVHPYLPSMTPMNEACKEGWPEAEALNLVDESLYADVGQDGSVPPGIVDRLAAIFRHCEASGAAGVIFTGSTFGPAVERARAAIAIPVLKSDEAMAEMAVRAGNRILLAGTAARSLPVVRKGLEDAAAAAGLAPSIDTALVADAQAEMARGNREKHDRLIAERILPVADRYDAIVFGQISMTPARSGLPVRIAQRTLTGPEAAVAKLRRLLAPAEPGTER